jgi:hypothetical protein
MILAPIWLFFAHGQSIWNISADGKDFQLQRAGLQKTAMFDIDIKVFLGYKVLAKICKFTTINYLSNLHILASTLFVVDK